MATNGNGTKIVFERAHGIPGYPEGFARIEENLVGGIPMMRIQFGKSGFVPANTFLQAYREGPANTPRVSVMITDHHVFFAIRRSFFTVKFELPRTFADAIKAKLDEIEEELEDVEDMRHSDGPTSKQLDFLKRLAEHVGFSKENIQDRLGGAPEESTRNAVGKLIQKLVELRSEGEASAGQLRALRQKKIEFEPGITYGEADELLQESSRPAAEPDKGYDADAYVNGEDFVGDSEQHQELAEQVADDASTWDDDGILKD